MARFKKIKKQCGEVFDDVTNPVVPGGTVDVVTGNELVGIPGPDNYVLIMRVHVFEPVENEPHFTTVCKDVKTEKFNDDFDEDGQADPVAKRKHKVKLNVRKGKNGEIRVELSQLVRSSSRARIQQKLSGKKA